MLWIDEIEKGFASAASVVAAAKGYSGAEIEQAILEGLFEVFATKKELTTEMLLTSLRQSPPLSVTMAERIEDLRAWGQSRCVPADD